MNSMSSVYRDLCTVLNVDAFIFLGTGPHKFESPEPQFQLRQHLSKFSGSAGTLVCHTYSTQTSSALWTDFRYEEAAKRASPASTEIYISKENDWNAQIQWIVDQCKTKDNSPLKIAISDLQFNVDEYKTLSTLARDLSTPRLEIQLVIIKHASIISTLQDIDPSFTCDDENIVMTPHSNYIDHIWHLHSLQDKHHTLLTEAFDYKHTIPAHYSSPIEQLQQWMSDCKYDVYISASAHELACLLDLRSISIPNLMVFPCIFAYYNKLKQVILWVPKKFHNKLSLEGTIASRDGFSIIVTLLEYQTIINNPHIFHSNIAQFNDENDSSSKTVVYDKHNIPISLYHEKYEEIQNPIPGWKSIRTEKEINHVYHACLFDSVALAEAIAKIHTQLCSNIQILESDVQDILYHYRNRNVSFLQNSFDTIAAVGEHAALPHYDSRTSSFPLSKNNILLLDTGGHYYYGTTDITRVFYFGNINKIPYELVEDYTFVLKAHINLSLYQSAVLSKNKNSYPNGADLDAVARTILANVGREYGHGTGHGVGMCTDVHEGVQRISPQSSQAIIPNMIFSNEPGIYKPSKWGIRIENIVYSYINNDHKLALEPLSFFPIQTSLIDTTLLNETEYKWLLSYNKKSMELLSPHIGEGTKKYLHDTSAEFYTQRNKL